MRLLDYIRDLYTHMEWADATVWRAVRALPEADKDASIHKLLCHIHMTQRVFLQVWRNEAPVYLKETDFATLDDVLVWCRPYYGEASQFLEGVNDEQLSAPAPVPWVKYFARRWGAEAEITTLGETLMQAALHSLYHRGQVNKRLRELGGEPPLVDYIAWIWMGRSEPNWGEDVS